jgi:hypothetical protein
MRPDDEDPKMTMTAFVERGTSRFRPFVARKVMASVNVWVSVPAPAASSSKRTWRA